MPRARALPSIERISTWIWRGTLNPGVSRAGSGRTSLYLSYYGLDLRPATARGPSQELLDRDLDELGRDALVLVAIGPEDVVGSDQRRRPSRRRTLLQADLVGDVGQELLAADPVVEVGRAAARRVRGSSGRLVIRLRNSLPDLGPGRHAQPVGLVLEDQGVDQIAVLQVRRTGSGRCTGLSCGHEQVGECSAARASR